MGTVRGFAAVAILALAAVPASAQPIISAKSGVIAGVEGKVLINNQEVQPSDTHFPELKEGAVLRTEDGRVELMLPPGFMLRMGENGALKMLANRLVDTRVELQAGSAVVEVDQVKEDFNVSIALKDGVVTLSKVGVYRFDSDPARLRVFHGAATVEIGGQSVMVATGRMLALAGTAATAEKFDVEQTDALDNWSRRRAEAMALANVSGAKYGNNSSTPSGSSWSYNPYFGMYTYIPMSGRMCNPFYDLCYYSPMAAYQTFYAPTAYYNSGGANRGYTLRQGSSSGTASSIAASSGSTSSASTAGMSSASSTAGAGAASSAGHGSAGGGGGHGK
jgi:hypothetical protein